MQQGGQNLAAGQPGMTAAAGPPNPGADSNPSASQAPPADVLYNNALRDYNSGKYDLSSQEFSDYIKYYSTTDLAGNAQFYLADIEYRQGNFEAAVRDYDKVLEQYPGGSKAAAAQLKKGYALLELGQREAGIRELQSLIGRYPRSIEASQARDRLRRLGVTSGSTVRKPAPHSPTSSRQSAAGDFLRRGTARQALGQNQFAGFCAKCWHVPAKADRRRDTCYSPHRDRPGSAHTMGQSASRERSQRRHAHKHHGVHRHDSAPQLIRNHRLNQRIGGSHLHHHGEAHRHEQHGRQPEYFRKREQDQAEPKSSRRKSNQLPQALHADTGRQAGRAQQRSH